MPETTGVDLTSLEILPRFPARDFIYSHRVRQLLESPLLPVIFLVGIPIDFRMVIRLVLCAAVSGLAVLLVCSCGPQSRQHVASAAGNADSMVPHDRGAHDSSGAPADSVPARPLNPDDYRGTLPTSLPSGTAVVRAVVQECSESETSVTTRCLLDVASALRYGPATPVVGQGRLSVIVPDGVRSLLPADRSQSLRFVLRHAGDRVRPSGQSPSGDSEPQWTIVGVNSG